MTTLRSLVETVATKLPDGPWTVTQPHEGDHFFTLTRPDGLTLSVLGLSGRYGRTGENPERLEVRYDVPKRRDGYANLRDWGIGTYADPISLPEATMTTSKSPDVLARDIARRVLAPSIPIHATIREHQASDTSTADALVSAAKRLSKAVPDLAIEIGRDRTGGTFRFYRGEDGLCLQGRIYSNATVSLDRVSTFPMGKLAAVLAVLKG